MTTVWAASPERPFFRVPLPRTRFDCECRVRGVREWLVALRPDRDEGAAPPASAGRRFGSCDVAADFPQLTSLRIDPSRLSRTEAHRRKQRCEWWPGRDAPAPSRAGLGSLLQDPGSDSSVTTATKRARSARLRCRFSPHRRNRVRAPGARRASRAHGPARPPPVTFSKTRRLRSTDPSATARTGSWRRRPSARAAPAHRCSKHRTAA